MARGFPTLKIFLKIRLFVSTEYINVTHGQTDNAQTTLHDGIGRAYAQHRAAINNQRLKM